MVSGCRRRCHLQRESRPGVRCRLFLIRSHTGHYEKQPISAVTHSRIRATGSPTIRSAL